MNRVLAFTGCFVVLVVNMATAQTPKQGSAQIAGTGGGSLGLYYDVDVTLDGKPDFIISTFHVQYGILKNGVLNPLSGVFMRSPELTFAANGSGNYSGLGNQGVTIPRNAPCKVQVFAVQKYDPVTHYRGTTDVIVSDDLGVVKWFVYQYKNVFCNIQPLIEVPVP